jgi:peptidoglycan/LPS O-acetylase OafA/YrhL
MEYRSEIDGLRTLAVLPVIFFHAGFAFFSGGFVGVDVFFIISGYLITGIIIRDLDRGRWSLLDFYERRARRILPALALVVACSWPVAWVIMLPLEMKDFAQSTAAAALSVSNILFFQESNYFDAAAELKPLLHTWSLGVEEQFYIIFPPTLALLWLWPVHRKIAVLGLAALLSFSLCMALVQSFPKAVFFLLPFRAWELLAGGFCAFWHSRNTRQENGTLALLGLVALVTSIVLFDSSTPFPSAYTLLPVLGTCLILLFAAPSNMTGRLLCMSPMVGIGLISYSAYLWHQPLLAFGRLYSPDPLSDQILLILALLSLPLAYLSWRFVEQPFRRREEGALLPGRALVMGLSASVIGLGAAAGALGHFYDGWPGRYTVEQQAFLDTHRWSSRCMFTRINPLGNLPEEECHFPAQGQEQGKVAFVGDSVMSSLSPDLIGLFTERGYTVEQFTHSHCTLHRHHRRDNIDAAGCPEFISRIVDYIAANDFDLVLTASNFVGFFSEKSDRIIRDSDEAVSSESLRADMAATIAATNAQLILVHPHPNAGVDVLSRAVRELRTHGRLSSYSTEQATFEGEIQETLKLLTAATPSDTIHVDLTSAFCDGTRCEFIHDGAPVLSDRVHFTNHGAHNLVRPQLEKALDQAGL